MTTKLLAFIALLLTLTSCNRQDTPLTPKTQSVSFRAAFVWRAGAINAVPREPFYLLKEDLAKVLESKNIKIDDFVMTPFQQSLDQTWPDRKVKPLGMDKEQFKEFIVGETTTDFEGNGKFENIPLGTYYLVGVAFTTKDQYALWNSKIEVSSDNEVILLDQKNAYKVGA